MAGTFKYKLSTKLCLHYEKKQVESLSMVRHGSSELSKHGKNT